MASHDASFIRRCARDRGRQATGEAIFAPPLAEDKRVRGYRTLALDWSETMAYIVGLLATDGCLSSDRRHIILTSRDRELVETFLACLGRPIKYTVGRTRRGKRAYYAQFRMWRSTTGS